MVSALLILAFALAAFYLVRGQAFDPANLMTYSRTDGPFLAARGPNGAIEVGTAVTRARAGETIGWISTLCLSPGVTELAQVRLVHVGDERVILYTETNWEPGQRSCGPVRAAITLPADLAPGSYEIRRTLLLTPARGAPRSVDLPAVRLEVAA